MPPPQNFFCDWVRRWFLEESTENKWHSYRLLCRANYFAGAGHAFTKLDTVGYVASKSGELWRGLHGLWFRGLLMTSGTG